MYKTIIVKNFTERDNIKNISDNTFVFVMFFGWYYLNHDKWIFIDDRRFFNE